MQYEVYKLGIPKCLNNISCVSPQEAISKTFNRKLSDLIIKKVDVLDANICVVTKGKKIFKNFYYVDEFFRIYKIFISKDKPVDSYFIYVKAKDEREALSIAKNKNLFEKDSDNKHINYIIAIPFAEFSKVSKSYDLLNENESKKIKYALDYALK